MERETGIRLIYEIDDAPCDERDYNISSMTSSTSFLIVRH